MKVLHVVVMCALLASVVVATETELDATADMEVSAEHEVDAETEMETEVDAEADAEVDTAADSERRKKKRDRVPENKTKWHRPHIDMSLLRPTANVVYVPKGDPRARPPTEHRQRKHFAHPHSAHHPKPVQHHAHRPATPTAKPQPPKTIVQQKAPRNGGKPKPAGPSNPAGGKPSGPGGVNVGGAAAPAKPVVLKSAAPQYASAACTAKGGSCTSSCSGTVYSGICPGPASIRCCIPSSSKPAANCLSNFNAASFAAKATSMQLAYRANGVVYSQSNRQFGSPPAVKYSDCSSFVTSVLDAMGWDCLFANGRYTAAMIPIMQSRGGFHSAPKLGDIVMWSSHTGIVSGSCASGQVRMVAMGLHGCADTGCIPLSQLPSWGSGSFLGFWTPH